MEEMRRLRREGVSISEIALLTNRDRFGVDGSLTRRRPSHPRQGWEGCAQGHQLLSGPMGMFPRTHNNGARRAHSAGASPTAAREGGHFEEAHPIRHPRFPSQAHNPASTSEAVLARQQVVLWGVDGALRGSRKGEDHDGMPGNPMSCKVKRTGDDGCVACVACGGPLLQRRWRCGAMAL